MIGFFETAKPHEAPFYWVNLPGEERPLLLLNYEIYLHIDETLGKPGPDTTQEWAPTLQSDYIVYDY